MTISMYQASVPVFIRMLDNLTDILKKAAGHAEAKGFEPGILLASRLRPDMLPLVLQVQIVTDGARGAALRLAGLQPPTPEDPDFAVFNRGANGRFRDEEETFAQMIDRVQDAIDFLRTLPAEQIDGSESRPLAVQMHGQIRRFNGLPFLLNYCLPSFYFHISVIYALLRQAGVDLGKRDFEGEPVYTVDVADQPA